MNNEDKGLTAKDTNAAPVKEIGKLPVKSFFFGGLVLVIVTLGFYFTHFHKKFSTSNGDWGTFGDFLGGTLNPVFSFASFVALLYTINLQREELDKSTQELAKSSAALNKQSETQTKQQFENTFFSLLEQHNNILNTLVSAKQISIINKYVLSRNGSGDLPGAKLMLQEHNYKIGHYFRILYQLLKLIAANVPGSNIGPDFNKEDISSKEFAPNEKMYSNIVRSFLDYETTQLLAINCFCINDDDSYIKFKRLVERYSLLEHMPFVFDEQSYDHPALAETKTHYAPKAFGKNIFIGIKSP